MGRDLLAFIFLTYKYLCAYNEFYNSSYMTNRKTENLKRNVQSGKLIKHGIDEMFTDYEIVIPIDENGKCKNRRIRKTHETYIQ